MRGRQNLPQMSRPTPNGRLRVSDDLSPGKRDVYGKLCAWVADSGTWVDGLEVAADKQFGMIGLRATRDLVPGDTVVTVPSSATFNGTGLFQQAGDEWSLSGTGTHLTRAFAERPVSPVVLSWMRALAEHKKSNPLFDNYSAPHMIYRTGGTSATTTSQNAPRTELKWAAEMNSSTALEKMEELAIVSAILEAEAREETSPYVDTLPMPVTVPRLWAMFPAAFPRARAAWQRLKRSMQRRHLVIGMVLEWVGTDAKARQRGSISPGRAASQQARCALELAGRMVCECDAHRPRNGHALVCQPPQRCRAGGGLQPGPLLTRRALSQHSLLLGARGHADKRPLATAPAQMAACGVWRHACPRPRDRELPAAAASRPEGGTVMVPVLDLFNHRMRDPHVEWGHRDGKWVARVKRHAKRGDDVYGATQASPVSGLTRAPVWRCGLGPHARAASAHIPVAVPPPCEPQRTRRSPAAPWARM